MDGRYLNKVIQLNAKHALYHAEGKWYHHLKQFPGVLFDKNGYVLFYNQFVYLNDPSLQRNKDVFIKDRLENHPSYLRFRESDLRLIYGLSIESKNDHSFVTKEESVRVIRQINSLLRKRSLVAKIKKLYDNTCQICGNKLQVGHNQFYSEVHHIIPLGHPYNGRDSLGNMICVCPNHHTLLDFKSTPLVLSSFKLRRHEISHDSLNHHNSLFRAKN